MKRALTCAGIFLLAGVSVAATNDSQDVDGDTPARVETRQSSGHLERGGAEIGRGYARAGREMGRGAAGFGKTAFRGQFGEAGRSLGSGAAGFGQGVGSGTARGFKKFGLAFRNLGKKIDRAVSEDR